MTWATETQIKFNLCDIRINVDWLLCPGLMLLV
jgi:hypothetical protein